MMDLLRMFGCMNVHLQLSLKVLYFRTFVYHSLSYEDLLEVFMSLNGDTGDIYAAQCSCVSG